MQRERAESTKTDSKIRRPRKNTSSSDRHEYGNEGYYYMIDFFSHSLLANNTRPGLHQSVTVARPCLGNLVTVSSPTTGHAEENFPPREAGGRASLRSTYSVRY